MSRVDRHEHIGKGCIGLEPFRRLLNDTRFAHLPMILETEKTEWRDRGKSGNRSAGRDEPEYAARPACCKLNRDQETSRRIPRPRIVELRAFLPGVPRQPGFHARLRRRIRPRSSSTLSPPAAAAGLCDGRTPRSARGGLFRPPQYPNRLDRPEHRDLEIDAAHSAGVTGGNRGSEIAADTAQRSTTSISGSAAPDSQCSPGARRLSAA